MNVLGGGNPQTAKANGDATIDDAQMARWMKQAAALPGFLQDWTGRSD